MEKERDLFSVGELTRALRITRRTLLYYEEFGLIRPDVRDGATGNRYYTIDTLVKLRTIRVLQNLGLSLSEIREYFDSAFELPPLIRRLESLRDELNRQIEGLQERSNVEPPQVKRVRLPQQTVYRRVYTAPTVAQRAALLRSTALEAMRLYGTDLTQQMYLVESRIGRPGETAFCVAVPPESRGEHVVLLPAAPALSLYHHGAYEMLPAAVQQLFACAQAQGLTPASIWRGRPSTKTPQSSSRRWRCPSGKHRADDRNRAKQGLDGLLQPILILRVDISCGLVQNDDGRVLQHGPRNGDALALAAGQVRPTSAYNGVVAVLQPADKAVAAGGAGRCLHLGVRGAHPAHADILPHGVGKKIVVLGHERHLLVELRQGDVPQIVPAHGDGAGLHIPEARCQLGQRGLAAAGGAYQRRHAVLRDGQTDAVQDLLVVVVSEGYVPELDAVSVKGDRRLTVGLLLCLEYLVHLRQRVHEVECGHDGRGHAQRQDDDRDECLRRHGAAHLIGGLHRTSKVSGVPAYGVSMGAWLTHRRMARAAELLLGDPQASIAEIGGMVGYDSASKFAAAFKKAMKLSFALFPPRSSARCPPRWRWPPAVSSPRPRRRWR